jgi:hypothetical protein
MIHGLTDAMGSGWRDYLSFYCITSP